MGGGTRNVLQEEPKHIRIKEIYEKRWAASMTMIMLISALGLWNKRYDVLHVIIEEDIRKKIRKKVAK